MKTIEDIIKDERDRILSKYTGDSLREYIESIIRDAVNGTILRILGFEQEYYRSGRDNKVPMFRVDHCNGRSGDSLIGNEIKEQAVNAINRMLPKLEIDKEVIRNIHRDVNNYYKKCYENELRTKARRKAEENARRYIENELSSVLKGDSEIVKFKIMD